MFLSLFFALTISGCLAADVAVPPPFTCGTMPRQVLECLGNPQILTADMLKNCDTPNTCDRMKCAFNNAGWLKDGTVQPTRIQAYFDQFAIDHPQWAAAVTRTKQACLTTNLPAQGVHLNCPPYDIMHCSFTNFAENAAPSQWSSDEKCRHAKQYVASCPKCPTDCFSVQVPYGSCNACYGLPRSP